jgi:hypothetical protein
MAEDSHFTPKALANSSPGYHPGYDPQRLTDPERVGQIAVRALSLANTFSVVDSEPPFPRVPPWLKLAYAFGVKNVNAQPQMISNNDLIEKGSRERWTETLAIC